VRGGRGGGGRGCGGRRGSHRGSCRRGRSRLMMDRLGVVRGLAVMHLVGRSRLLGRRRLSRRRGCHGGGARLRSAGTSAARHRHHDGAQPCSLHGPGSPFSRDSSVSLHDPSGAGLFRWRGSCWMGRPSAASVGPGRARPDRGCCRWCCRLAAGGPGWAGGAVKRASPTGGGRRLLAYFAPFDPLASDSDHNVPKLFGGSGPRHLVVE
jgi:hypothetical protein